MDTLKENKSPAIETRGGQTSCQELNQLRTGTGRAARLGPRRRPLWSFLRLHEEIGGAEARSETVQREWAVRKCRQQVDFLKSFLKIGPRCLI